MCGRRTGRLDGERKQRDEWRAEGERAKGRSGRREKLSESITEFPTVDILR